jgi:hypothetical protein
VTGAEGLIVKDLAGVYRAGGRGSSWWKYKRRVTAEAIIGGIIGAIEDPRALLLGRIDSRRRLRYVARTVPLALSQRQEIGRMLTAATGAHPWPEPLPAAWNGQLDRPAPQSYVQMTRCWWPRSWSTRHMSEGDTAILRGIFASGPNWMHLMYRSGLTAALLPDRSGVCGFVTSSR